MNWNKIRLHHNLTWSTSYVSFYHVYSLPPGFLQGTLPTLFLRFLILPIMETPIISLHYYFSVSLQELKLPVYRGHSPQIGMRRYFADLLAILSNRYQLCPTARHLAVYLLDLFMDHYDVAVKQLYVIALTCLLLASKCIFRLHLSLWLLFFVLLLRIAFYLLNLIKMWMPRLL